MVLLSNCSLMPNGSEPGLVIFQRVSYTLVFILGLVLNVTALWRFMRTPHWTDTHIYMLSLLIADLLVIVFLPFRILETYCPMEKTGFCTFLICVHYNNMYISILTIMAISIHRCVLVRFPMKSKFSRASEAKRKKITYGICVFIWLLVMLLSLIFWQDMAPTKLKTCYERKGTDRMTVAFILVLEIVGFFLPVVTITTCSTLAIFAVLKSLKDIRQHTMQDIIDKRKRIVSIITANMIVFIVCFTPIHVGYLLRYIFQDDSSIVNIFYDIAEWLATTNCCLDSVGYYFLLKKVFRDNL